MTVTNAHERNIARRRLLLILLVLTMLLPLCACGAGRAPDYDRKKCSVVIEDNEDYSVNPKHLRVERGSDVSIRVRLSGGKRILSCDYADYALEDDGVPTVDGITSQILTLHDVRYPTVVSIETYTPCVMRYYANGGERRDGGAASAPVELPGIASHTRLNTAQGTALFLRDGYTLTSWNTAPDGGGTSVGLGSRIDFSGTAALYAQWAAWSPASDFTWTEDGEGVRVTDCAYAGDTLVIPAKLGGRPVTVLAAGAFAGLPCKTVILPDSLKCVEKRAFADAAIEELILFDTLTEVYDESFQGCPIRTLHINAARAPVYSGTYFDTFPDKMDRLITLADTQKLVLFSGSSARFGYDSAMLDEAMPDYAVVNMGVYAYSSAKPQYELICRYMQAGDILLSAPEFDAIPEQFCATDNLWYEFFAMTEANYDLISLLDLRNYAGVFEDFRAYQTARAGMREQSYDISAKNHDEDGNPVAGLVTYNEYGDYVYPRPNQEGDGLFGIKRASYLLRDFPPETVECLNQVYRWFLHKGVTVWFSYAPRSEHSVTQGSDAAERALLDACLRETLCVPVISDIEESLYPAAYFYGTDNHLSDEGVHLRTERVIADIRAQLDGKN